MRVWDCIFKKDWIRFGVQPVKKDLNHLHQLAIQVRDQERLFISHIINVEAQVGIVMYDMADPESFKQTINHLEELKNKGSPKSGTIINIIGINFLIPENSLCSCRE